MKRSVVPSHLRLLDLLQDKRWHSLPQIVRAIRSYRVSSAVYRLKKLGWRCTWRPEKRGTSYKLVA